MGGGTTLVEASLLGRNSIGFDINELAHFISKIKITSLTDDEVFEIQDWGEQIDEIKITRNLGAHYSNRQQKHLHGKTTWRVRSFIEAAMERSQKLNGENGVNFIRGVLLKTAQWALDGKRTVPMVAEFREKFKINLSEMLFDLQAYSAMVEKFKPKPAVRMYHGTADSISLKTHLTNQSPRLIIMSPPYPGIHVLYHRWQVQGRRETPAPYWIAGCQDGASASHYTLGGRRSKEHQAYFDAMQKVFENLARIANTETYMVQLVGFSEPKAQLPRYLEIVRNAGFKSVSKPQTAGIRSVPNRKWYTQRDVAAPRRNEYLLIHKLG